MDKEHMTRQKQIISPFAIFKNKNIDLLSPGIYAPGAEILFGSVNRPENTRGYQEMCGVGFRVRGIRK